MPRYRHALPQLGDGLFVADGGLETTLIYEHGIALRDFAAFELLKDR
jgi:homocysteine S-methyltransferase